MIEITSTPIVLMIILGVTGMAIPVINVIRKEKGSSTFYGTIAFAALIISIGSNMLPFDFDIFSSPESIQPCP